MYFEIENTPEHIRRARRSDRVKQESPKEVVPRLLLAPFSKPPQVVFDNVLIGSTCERYLEVFNPSKQSQQITLDKALPPGLVICIPGEWLEVEPETCYCLSMTWTPSQPTAMRETLRFTNGARGRYDIIVVLKSIMNIKGKGKENQVKGLKLTPGKMKKKTALKKSPVAIYKKKISVINKTTKINETIEYMQKTYDFNKENVSMTSEYSVQSYPNKCPFDSPTSLDMNFNTSEIFSNMRKTDILQNTYEKPKSTQLEVPSNVLKPSNQQTYDTTATDLFDDLTFTPLKSVQSKTDKLDKGPRIILSVNSESDFDDSLDLKNSNKENETHSIITITSTQPPNKWLTNQTHVQNQMNETPQMGKKHPNTSSPKEINSPNFSINTDFSRISDLSFFPQRFSTERKCFARVNETHELIDENKFGWDTFTKFSPCSSVDCNVNLMERPPHYFHREPKVCRQSLFREANDRNYLHEHQGQPNFYWQSELRDRSPPRSITPPLQAIPEESAQFSETQILDKTDKQMATFTINRTFDKASDRSLSTTTRQTWSKKAVRAEPELWKMPVAQPRKSLKPKMKPKESIGSKITNVTFESNKSINQNITINQYGNVYSQSFTVDPFLSSTYFYDEEAVFKFEKEFKRWLNCILTPPADLESNIEQKIDVGKAWIENRNKEVPLAPTKEQVCSNYHNSHRLESLRRSARVLLMSSEIAQVFQKLNAQIEKKLIAVRNDRNLHLDAGLQKIIMELLLSYNPLWLRIGLEAIYGIVLPLKSNSDIVGLTTFIIQRMFKNPFLKNKHSKSNAPNMLLPAYMEAIKKFTLKKFFMLVYFLDQAKQRKLISHDPCLFCRNAVCKESREIVIRFTRELIAGIGDITKHLRPLGYVVSHKQSYLDEYKYAVNNLALDIRDGVRLTKVMEIILMKNGLLNQLRTPAISRLQKIHNVSVALNALKEANFVIVGDITPVDIADGHREKTLSLLWQLIHVFRAPLFEKAANVIQMWWRKKFEVIVEKRKEEARVKQRFDNAASVIQTWWRRIQFNRQVEWQMQLVTKATIIVQKYCRMWLCRTRLRTFKTSVLIIEQWYKSLKLAREAKLTLNRLRFEREQLRRTSAIVIQSHIRQWLCQTRYTRTRQCVIKIQSLIKAFIVRKQYLQMKKTVTYVQEKYRGKLLMRTHMRDLATLKRNVVIVQSYYRMIKQRRSYLQIKKSVQILETRYKALSNMRQERDHYLKLKETAIKLQALYRRKKCRDEYIRYRNSITLLQRRVRANQAMKKERQNFLQVRNATITLQKYIKSYLIMKKIRSSYLLQRSSTISIQRFFKSYLLCKNQRESYLKLRNASIVLQRQYKSLLLMRKDRTNFVNYKNAVIRVQRQYRAQREMKQCKENYKKLRNVTIAVQQKYRAIKQMRVQQNRYNELKSSCIKVQNAFRAYLLGKRERNEYLKQKEAAVTLQRWYRNIKRGKEVKQNYEQIKKACVAIQTHFRAYIIGRTQRKEFIRMKTAVTTIQQYYKSYIITRTVRTQFIQIKTSTIKIQRYYRSHLLTKKQRETYLRMKSAVSFIENYYRRYKLSKSTREEYIKTRQAAIVLQRRYRSNLSMKTQKLEYTKLKQAITVFQTRYRALLCMRKERQYYLQLRKAAIVMQTRYRSLRLMRKSKHEYQIILKSAITIQTFYRAYKLGSKQRTDYLNLKKSVILLEDRYKALLAMRRERLSYLMKIKAVICIQKRYISYRLMVKQREEYLKMIEACKIIQRSFKAVIEGRKQRTEYLKLKTAVTVIQSRYRNKIESRNTRNNYLKLKRTAIHIQRTFRANQIAKSVKENNAATKIQSWYKSVKLRDNSRNDFLEYRNRIVICQSVVRMFIHRRRFVGVKTASTTIQRYYRAYKLASTERAKYVKVRQSIVKVQSYVRSFIQRKQYLKLRSSVLLLQAVYRLRRYRETVKKQREGAAICLQKNVRKYLAQKTYTEFRAKLMYIQQKWRGKLLVRLLRCGFLQKRRLVISIQAIARGYIVRKQIECKKQQIIKIREEKRRYWAASKIQALFRGHKARTLVSHDKRVADLRRRWREGALESTQESLKERNEYAMEVLRNMRSIETVIMAFRSLELLTEVFPMMYNDNASCIVDSVYVYMSVTNRSISSIEVLKSAAAVLVNLTRYKVTGPKIYERDRIAPILKFMWRFSNSETHLFCILCTYLWLFGKYDDVREDLRQYLHIQENHKMMMTIKGNVDRMKRMASNSKNKFSTPQTSKFVSHTNYANQSCNLSMCSLPGIGNILLPTLEPDYGIVRVDKPRYFEDAQQAINCLFRTYSL